MESHTFTPLFQHIPESSDDNNELVFLDNFDMEANPDIRRVLSSLSKIEIVPDSNLVEKVLHSSEYMNMNPKAK